MHKQLREVTLVTKKGEKLLHNCLLVLDIISENLTVFWLFVKYAVIVFDGKIAFKYIIVFVTNLHLLPI